MKIKGKELRKVVRELLIESIKEGGPGSGPQEGGAKKKKDLPKMPYFRITGYDQATKKTAEVGEWLKKLKAEGHIDDKTYEKAFGAAKKLYQDFKDVRSPYLSQGRRFNHKKANDDLYNVVKLAGFRTNDKAKTLDDPDWLHNEKPIPNERDKVKK